MNIRNIRTGAVLGLFVILGSLLAGQATEVKIKVIVENASIRVKPGIDGAVLEDKIPVGAVYLSSKKEGEWYEVRFRSRVGVQLTGYIHEMYVEVIDEDAAKAGQQPPIFKGMGPVRVQEVKPFEMGLIFGLSAGSFMSPSSTYSDTWAWSELESVSEAGTISHKLGNPLALGFSFTYYFRENVGFRLSVDYNLKQNLADAKSAYQIDWTWTLGRGSFHDEGDWPVKGDFWLVPISANLIYKIPTGGIFAPYLTAGMTAYLGRANIETSLGYSNSWISSDGKTQLIDFFIIPVKVEKDLTTAGVNVGAGLDVLLSPNIALNIDGVYYWGSSYSDDWPVTEGTYPASYYTGTTLTIDWMQASDFKAKITKLSIKLSSFRIAAGLKILF
ncbi:MAG: outer membrane beta-barrel protein [Candidatus Aminicenantes bacterium]|nr:outer membrane beta-barrel protein [Candidatus Aminicenantes bacterium]